jgi:hypothetical protein
MAWSKEKDKYKEINMWWKFCKVNIEDEELYEKVYGSIKKWLSLTQPYARDKKPLLHQNSSRAYEIGDTDTYDLLMYFNDFSYEEKVGFVKDFIKHFANHPSIKGIAQELNVKQSNVFNTPEKIKGIISDWYKAEYRLTLAKQNHLSNTKNMENEFKILSRRLADMIILAANNWIKNHRSTLLGIYRKTEENRDDFDKQILEIEKKMKWVIEKMSVPNPNQGDMSIAIQICHWSGTIMEYIPHHKNQINYGKRYDMSDMKEFLSGLSQGDFTPEIEKEYNNIIPHIQALPDTWRDYDATNWRQAKKKKWNTRK